MKYDLDTMQEIWDGLTIEQQIDALQHAKDGNITPPDSLRKSSWNVCTHYFKEKGWARVALIEGGDCEAIELNDLGIVVLNSLEQRAKGRKKPKKTVEPSFRSIIQYHDKDGLLKRLHELIDDETSPSMVGAIMLRASATFECLIKRTPKREELYEEFPQAKKLKWKSIQNYMNPNDNDAMVMANGIIIFYKEMKH